MRLNFDFGFGVKKHGGGVPLANPNLLLWSESLEQAAWTPTSMVVTPDVDGTGDELVSTGVNAALRQVTGVAAASGAAVATVYTPSGTSTPSRGSVTGTFDGLQYTFSIEGRDSGGGESYTLRLDRSGGFLRLSIEETVGDGVAIFYRAQLEQAAAFTTYHFRGGV